MINSRPNGVGNYRQGLYVPLNKDKVFKLNEQGGLYYRSSWELTAMKYFDMCEDVSLWGCECIEIPYQLTKPDKFGVVKVTNHRYFPDFYYKLKMKDNTIREILLEVKPVEQTRPPKWKDGSRLTQKQLKSYEWSINEYNRNMCKWEATLEYCVPKGIEFKFLVKEHVDIMKKNYINKFS
tara:strand:- start:2800 stop:3339 length:540 start_codon:yes stop_codon:yes gene_type:complete